MGAPITTSTPPKLEVAVAGGGIAGLTVAIALLRHPGVDVRIYERATEFKEIGASISLSPNGLRTLEKLGAENAISGDVCTRQSGEWPMIFRHWQTGEIISHDVHYTVKTKKHFTARYHRAHLHQALLENIPREIVHLGKKTTSVRVTPENRTVLLFEDGTSAEADICIGADGIHSMVRKSFVPDHQLRWTGWVALRSTFDASLLKGIDFPVDAAHWIGHDRTFFHGRLGKGQFTAVGGFHADPSDPDSPYYNTKWDEEGSIEVFKQYYKGWNPVVQALIQATPSTKLYPNVAGEALKTWAFEDRVTLVGDAAHTHGGAFAAGGSLAIDDAYALALALEHVWPSSAVTKGKPSSQQLRKVFQLYERTRKPHINRVLDVVRHQVVGQKLSAGQVQGETEEELVKRVMNRMDPAWISEHDVEAAFRAAVQETDGGAATRQKLASISDKEGLPLPRAGL